MDKSADVVMTALTQLQRVVQEQAKRFDYAGSESVNAAFAFINDAVGDVLNEAAHQSADAATSASPSIKIDPAILGGEPCVAGRRIPVSMVAEVVEQFGVSEAQDMWGLRREEVLVACWYSAQTKPAWQTWQSAHSEMFAVGNWDSIPDPGTATTSHDAHSSDG